MRLLEDLLLRSVLLSLLILPVSVCSASDDDPPAVDEAAALVAKGAIPSGPRVVSGGDANGDGVQDIAVADWTGPYIDPNGEWVVRVYSGESKEQLWAVTGGRGFGAALAFIPDANDDGCDELVIVANPPATGDPYSVELVSGATGVRMGERVEFDVPVVGIESSRPDGRTSRGGLLVATVAAVYLIDGPQGTRKLVYESERRIVSFRAIGDVDTDGVIDYGAMVKGYDKGATTPRVCVIIGGADWNVIREHGVLGSDLPTGFTVAPLDDVDADGVDDYLLADMLDGGHGKHAGVVTIASGATGHSIRTIPPLVNELGCGREDGAGDYFGTAVAVLWDCDGDGTRDFAVTAPCTYEKSGPCAGGYVAVFSGRSGRLLSFAQAEAKRGFGSDAFGLYLSGRPGAGESGAGELLVGVDHDFGYAGDAGRSGVDDSVVVLEWKPAGRK